MFRFASPWWLSLVPMALGCIWIMARRRRRGDARILLPQASVRFRLGRSPWQMLEPFVPWIRGLSLVLLLLALARPQAGERLESVATFGVDIVTALDVSASMRAMDFEPNRLVVARKTIESFVRGRPSDRIGLVIFGGIASTRCPLTLDHEMLLDFLGEVDFATRDQGTALGMGLASAVNRLRDSDAKSRVVVLVTDGRNNSGQIGPETAAEAARALGIRVYTVGVGSEGEVPVPVSAGPLGDRIVKMKVDLDEELLQEIASMTDGRYFRATDGEALEAVFETIDGLERTEIESRVRFLYTELFALALFPALGLLLFERCLVGTRLRRIP